MLIIKKIAKIDAIKSGKKGPVAIPIGKRSISDEKNLMSKFI